MGLHEKHQQWIESRNLDPVLAEKLGLKTEMRFGKAWIAIPYLEDGVAVNHKYRLTSEKGHYMDPEAPLVLWNVDCLSDPKVRNGQAPLVITEGEWDAIAAIQSGCLYAVSVPNGAPGKPTADIETAKRYEWVDRHADALSSVREFVIAADNDQAGFNLAADLVALLGADRCRFIEYPFPCKDLNEVLKEYGPERVMDCILTAKPYPVKGLYKPSDFPERGEVRAYPIGIAPLHDMVHIVPGTLTVLTGYSNMGKSSLMNAIIAHCINHNFPVCLASFETEVKPILIDGLRKSLLRCDQNDLAKEDLADVDRLIEQRLTVISQSVDEDMEMDLEEFLRLARIAVVRHGAKMIVLDPWNELEHKRRRDETETDYIGRAIRAIKRFAKQNDVAFWLVAHPTKPQMGVSKIPGLYDISGSANFANKADYGLTYHRANPKENRATIRVTKVRMGLPGRKDEVDVTFDFRDSTFKCAA